MLVDSQPYVGESFRNNQFTHSKLHTLSIKLPIAHMLDSTGYKSSRVARYEMNIFDFKWEAMQNVLLTQDVLSGVVN